jgi:hypothetical protein
MESVVLDFPLLTTVHGGIEMRDLPRLCTLKAASLTRVTGSVILSNIPNLPAASFAPMRAAARGTGSQLAIGCCSLDSIACTEFTADARDKYCGC